MKRILVKNCGVCPYKRDDNGGGHVEPFIICEKYYIILDEKYEGRWISLDEIHPECKLEEAFNIGTI
jgi:hypothetical protein